MARNKNTINNNEFTVLLTCPPPTTPLFCPLAKKWMLKS